MPGRGRPFPKGTSGNPAGRPKSNVTVSELAREHGPRVIEVLAQLMNDEKVPASTRALAADRILDRGYGKPPQLNTADAGQFRRARDLSDDELAAIIDRAQSATVEPDAEPQPTDPKKVN
jgi:uncharacterized protein (UPF0147 family)